MPRTIVSLAFIVLLALGSCSPKPEEAKTQTEETEAPKPVEVAVDAASFPEVVAKVNGASVAKAFLLERVAGMEAQGAVGVRSLEFYRRVVNDLIGAELLFQASTDRKLAATPAEVNDQINAMRSRFPDPAQFEQALASEGLTVEKLRDQIQRNMSIQKLIEADIASKVQITDEEVRKFYDENPEQMRQPDQLRVRHILKRAAPDAPPESREAARTAIEKIREQAVSGSNFAALAKEHSEDPGSAANGGELVIRPGETVPPFEKAAFALEPNGLSPVVETQFGFHVIQLQEKIAGQPVPYEEVRARIQDYLKQRDVQERIESTLEILKKDADVEVLI